MEKVFDDVLLPDEKLIKVIKPNKKRFNRDFYFMLCIPPNIILLIIGLALILPAVIYVLCNEKSYKNLYYAYTDKRIIIRSGISNIQYKSLEYKDTTYTSVKVGFLDKGLNTGTISFNSPSAPKKDPEYEGYDPMSFRYIENPYEVLKDIKKAMNKQ